MSYNLFIDDERNPADVLWADWIGVITDWKIARNWFEVRSIIHEYGMPQFISFDHDLSDFSPNGYWIAKNLVVLDMDKVLEFPENFKFFVHSKNPVGAKNIQKYLESYMRHKYG